MNRHTRHLIELVLVVALAVFFGACSNKKNTAGSRFWQSLNTRYNVYYHGRTNYDEQLKEMLDNYQDDYSQRLFVHPAEARANPKAPQPSGSFDRTIEKMQKAIALHSIKKKPNKKSGKGNDPKYKAWMAREEYNPFMHNCWYTLALAQYMKGDFLNASATFRYISRHFSWKPDLVEEAKVWEALSYCAMGWTSEADNVLSHVHLDKINNKRVRSLANLAFADYYIKEKRTALAVPYLAEAVKGAKGSQKVRQNFLLGQLYEELDQKDMAYEAFKRAGSSNSASYRTKFNARIKQSAVYQGYDIAGEVRALKHMTRYDRNKEYLDQIYYAIGNLYLSREDTVHAVENYVLAAEKSTRNGIDKAISQLKLGGIYFAQHKYDKAQPCYAEAVPQLSEDYPNYKALKQRSDVLDELAVYAGNVTLQDSLLKLSKMSDTEVKAVIKKIIDELKKKEKEERENADRESYLADQAAKGNTQQQNKNAPQQFSMNNDKSWYFYNTQTKNAGKTQFQQRWGNRKLEDNWRRRNKQVFSLDGGSTLSDSTLQAMVDSLGNDSIPIDTAALRRAEDPHYEEYYLKQIPKTEEQIQAAHEIIQEGLYNMGVILKDKLEDYEAAAVQFTRLLTDYPDNTYRLDTYYNMYLMYMREGSVNRAAVYRNMILSDFADSKEGKALLDPNYIENLKRMNIEQERMYAEAYANYLNDNNEAVHEAYAEMMRKYPLSKIMPKFMFIDALSYVTQRNYDKFKETLKDMLQRYPETDITPTASGIVKHLNAGRKLEGGGSNARGMLWSTRLSNDTTPQALEGKFTPFKEDNDKPQVFILLYPTDTVSSRLLLYEVARHNFNSFVVKDYDLEQMNFGHLGLLVVKGFENFNEVSHYRKVFDADKSMQIPPQVHQVLISESNFQLLLNEGRTFEDYFNYLQEQEEAKAEKIKKGDKKTSSDDNQDEPDGKKRSVKDKKGKKDDDKKEQLSDSTMVQPIDSLDLSKSQPIDSLQKAMSQPTDSLQTNLTQITDTVSLLTEAEKQLQAQLQQAERERLAQLEREKKEKEEQAEQERLEQMRRQRQEELERAAKLDQELLEKKEQERKEQEMREKEERERRDAEEREKRMQQAENAEKPAMKPDEPAMKPDEPAMKPDEPAMKPDEPAMKPDEPAMKPDEPAMKPDEPAMKPDEPAMKPDEPAMKPDEPAMKPDEPAMKPDEPTSSEKTEKTEAEKLGTRSVRDKKSDTSQVTASPKQDKKAQEKAERERLKALDKAEKERAKQLEKEEKEREKALKKEQKEREKAEKRAERMRQDSLLRAEENREKLYKSAREAKEDSIEALQKAKADEIKNKQKEREQAKKDAEKARKERLKAKEKERKLKEKERKERMKEREAKRKEQQKLRKQQQKDREKANKERQKQREEERKQQAAERKAAKGGKSSGGTNATTGRSSRNNTKDGKASGKSTTGKSSVDNNGNAPATGSNDKPDNSGNDKPDLTDNPDGSGKP